MGRYHFSCLIVRNFIFNCTDIQTIAFFNLNGHRCEHTNRKVCRSKTAVQ
jgi:hypothetical protein